jgi:hypothetical protein
VGLASVDPAFGRPLLEVVSAVLQAIATLGTGVVLITYVSWLTLALLDVLGRL